MGQAPLKATVFEMERLRCNACCQVFTAAEPAGVGAEKYDTTAVAMIALLKYGTGMPFNRMERLETQLGIPLPAATQWELMEAAAKQLKPHTGRVHPAGGAGQRGSQRRHGHADTEAGAQHRRRAHGNLHQRHRIDLAGVEDRAVLYRMETCGRESRRCSEATRGGARCAHPDVRRVIAEHAEAAGVEILLANCLAHGRRQFTEVAANFPEECRYVLESLGAVYGFDAEAKERGLTPEERLTFHQTHSAPVMEELHQWMETQFAEHKTEPNSGLGKAISYLLRHWTKLTLFLRQPGAPLDNNIVERALKKAILHRKNALFYKTMNGARVGDLFMSLIHTCELNKVNPFDYLTELLRHPAEVTVHPAEWMPWNYRRDATAVAA